MKPRKLMLSAVLLMPFAVSAADKNSLTASVRIGGTVTNSDNTDPDFSISNFGTRIIWKGEKSYDNGLTGIGYVELGLNPDANSRGDSGADRTRHLWGGIKGDFGTVKIGAQYAAFYDLVSGNTDIAWWGSCWTQFECARETRVLKYSGSTNDISYSASIQGNPADDGNDIADELEFGFNSVNGPVTWGFAASIRADEGDADVGALLGAVAKGKAGPVDIAVTLQRADGDFSGTNDIVTNTTLAASYNSFYAVLNATDNNTDDNPAFGTLGYTWNLGEKSLMYFEYQFVDNGINPLDGVNGGHDRIVRATYKYDFGVL